MTDATPTRRPARTLAVLSVRSSRWISPHTVRLTVGGPGFSDIRSNEYTDKYVKISFADVTRTYTVRRMEPDQQQLDLDFVVHGDDGIAAPWAANAQPGDTLTLSGAGGGYAPAPDDDWHLFVGDESALPAISSALEALPSDARGIAYLESQEGHPDDISAPAGVELRWLHRANPGTTPLQLAEALATGPWLPGRVGVFAHGEREAMKAIRAELKGRDLNGGQLSLSGYWAYGRTEDRFQAEKREPIGQIN